MYVNDAILVDPGGGTFNTLFQTWSEWASSELKKAVDRIAALELRNAELETLIADARSRLASLESDEVNDDAVDSALLTLISSINTRLTALESAN